MRFKIGDWVIPKKGCLHVQSHGKGPFQIVSIDRNTYDRGLNSYWIGFECSVNHDDISNGAANWPDDEYELYKSGDVLLGLDKELNDLQTMGYRS